MCCWYCVFVVVVVDVVFVCNVRFWLIRVVSFVVVEIGDERYARCLWCDLCCLFVLNVGVFCGVG